MPATKSALPGSPCAVPATKSALRGSQSAVPATKSALRGSPSAVPATKSASGYVHIWVNVGDCGPDQAGTRSWVRTLLTHPGFENQLAFMNSCGKHQYLLIAKSSLELLDSRLKHLPLPMKHYSSLATLTHTWRGHLAKIRKTAWSLSVSNEKILFRLPPLAIAGRWASVL